MIYAIIGAVLGVIIGLAIAGDPLWGGGVGFLVGLIFSGMGSRGTWGEEGAKAMPGWSERHAQTAIYKVGTLILFILILASAFLCAILGASLQ